MILQIDVNSVNGKEKVNYASVKKRDGADVVTLRIKNANAIPIQVMMQVDLGSPPELEKWDPLPNDDGTPFVITSDGCFGFRPANNYIQLIVPDGTITEEIIAELS